ncbi:MAG: RNA polymerase sigma factor [Candidatus Omnitrophota bacterium]
MIDEEVIKRACAGDIDSFETIFNAYKNFVFNVSLKILGQREDAQEVTQEVFMKVYHSLKFFRFQSSFKTWIYRITMNMAINRAKKESKTRDRTIEYDDTLGFSASGDQEIDKEHKAGMLNKLLDALTPDQRACIVLKNIEGLSYEAIAQTLNIHINSVRSRIKRARWKLLALKKESVLNEL